MPQSLLHTGKAPGLSLSLSSSPGRSPKLRRTPPFAMGSLHQAYWIGRKGAAAHEGVITFAYCYWVITYLAVLFFPFHIRFLATSTFNLKENGIWIGCRRHWRMLLPGMVRYVLSFFPKGFSKYSTTCLCTLSKGMTSLICTRKRLMQR